MSVSGNVTGAVAISGGSVAVPVIPMALTLPPPPPPPPSNIPSQSTAVGVAVAGAVTGTASPPRPKSRPRDPRKAKAMAHSAAKEGIQGDTPLSEGAGGGGAVAAGSTGEALGVCGGGFVTGSGHDGATGKQKEGRASSPDGRNTKRPRIDSPSAGDEAENGAGGVGGASSNDSSNVAAWSGGGGVTSGGGVDRGAVGGGAWDWSGNGVGRGTGGADVHNAFVGSGTGAPQQVSAVLGYPLTHVAGSSAYPGGSGGAVMAAAMNASSGHHQQQWNSRASWQPTARQEGTAPEGEEGGISEEEESIDGREVQDYGGDDSQEEDEEDEEKEEDEEDEAEEGEIVL